MSPLLTGKHSFPSPFSFLSSHISLLSSSLVIFLNKWETGGGEVAWGHYSAIVWKAYLEAAKTSCLFRDGAPELRGKAVHWENEAVIFPSHTCEDTSLEG